MENNSLSDIVKCILKDCNLNTFDVYKQSLEIKQKDDTRDKTHSVKVNTSSVKVNINGVKGVLPQDLKLLENLPAGYDIYVLDSSFYQQVVEDGSIGLGESYMKQKWITPHLLKVFKCLTALSETDMIKKYGAQLLYHCPKSTLKVVGKSLLSIIQTNLFNLQTLHLSKRVAQQHYDLPPLLYRKMLDSNMQYSCGYWSNNSTQYNSNQDVKNLEEAQQRKLQLIASKLLIQDNMTILDVGCGWGGAAAYIAKQYPTCRVVGISISKEQVKYAQETHKNVENVEYKCIDYRDPILLTYEFDRVYSIGAFEHFGYANYLTFFNIVSKLLKPTGIFLLHTITTIKESLYQDKWVDKYIFPGGRLASLGRIIKTGESTGSLICEDVQCFGLDYAKTLHAWKTNFNNFWNDLTNTGNSNNNSHNNNNCTSLYPQLEENNINRIVNNEKVNNTIVNNTIVNNDIKENTHIEENDVYELLKLPLPRDEFYRMWNYYLDVSAAAFEERVLNLSQFIFTKQRYKTYVRPFIV